MTWTLLKPRPTTDGYRVEAVDGAGVKRWAKTYPTRAKAVRHAFDDMQAAYERATKPNWEQSDGFWIEALKGMR